MRGSAPTKTDCGESLNALPLIRVQRLVRRFVRMFKCDTARITSHLGKHFLIIGHNRNTKDDPGVWTDGNGNRRDWDYVKEQVIASGGTEAELVASAKHYKKLCGMSMEEYLRSLASPNAALSDLPTKTARWNGILRGVLPLG